MYVNKKHFLFIILFYCIAFHGYSQKTTQERDKLEKQKKENLKKIDETSKILTETQFQKTATIGQLNALNQKMKNVETLISSISKEISILEKEMNNIGNIANAMQQDLNNLKKEYAAMIYAASKLNVEQNKLFFIFSSKSFNQLYMRLKYLEQYANERKIQVEQINKVKATLLVQKEKINGKRLEQNELLKYQRKENQNLNNLKGQQNELVKALSLKEKDLQKEVAERKKSIATLDKMIATIIANEVKKSAKSTVDGKKTPEAILMSSNFEGNKARFSWPVESGFISQKFGKQQHAVLKGIYIDNKGVDIQTNKGQAVRSIFDGKIEFVGQMPGLGSFIMVKHGEFFTIYSRLGKVNVAKDQIVKAKDTLGEVMVDKDGIAELHFEIWKNHSNLDPEAWLAPAKH